LARDAALIALAAVLLGLVSFLSVNSQIGQNYSPVYPESGIALALMWRHGARFWPALFLCTTLLSMYLGTPWFAATGVGWLDVLMALIALQLFRRWEVDPGLRGIRDLGWGVMAMIVTVAVAFPIYALREYLVFGDTPAEAISLGIHFSLATLFSYVIFTPLLLRVPEAVADRGRRWPVIGAAVATLAIGALVLSFGRALQESLLYLLLPLVVMAAVTGRMAGASAAAAAVTFVVMAMGGLGVVTLTEDALHTVFVATVTVTGYLLALSYEERARTMAVLDHLARHDTLTGLVNRHEFEARLRAVLHDASRSHALLFIDLERLSLVNETCGHVAGGEMLRALSARLQGVLPPGASLARLGGDQLGCLLDDASVADAERVARALHEAIESFEHPVGELRFSVDASIGVTFTSTEDDAPADVLARADLACRAAAAQGRNRTRLFAPNQIELRERAADIKELSQLEASLTQGRWQLYLQRIVNIRDESDQRPFYEVLLRSARHDDRRPIDELFGLATRYGLVGHIDRWVFEQSARVLGQHRSERLRLTVNVTATTLETEGFTEFVLGLPRKHGFEAQQMCLEITERDSIQNLARAVEALRVIRQRKFEIALDDFGAGVANFGYLSDLPVTMAKIDGRFVRDLASDPAAAVIIDSLARICALRGIPCIAEWVEDAAVIPRLRGLGVSYAQGYGIHRPSPVAELVPGSTLRH
jgi:diguanylate cyclase (GGDEF)-like protein